MKHLKRAATAALVILASVVPLILASPAAQHFVERHPADAAYVPIVLGIVRAIVTAAKSAKTTA